MSKTIRVTAPYVTLKVTDQINGTVLVGYYEGAIVENVDDVSAQHHIDAGMAVAAGEDDDPAGPPIIPAELRGDYSANVASLDSSHLAGGADVTASVDEPAGNASKEEWVEFARSRGASEEDVADLNRNELREKYQSATD